MFTNAVHSAVPASFEPPPPGSPQSLTLVPVILAAAVLTSPQVPDLEDLASLLRQAVATSSPVTTPEAPVDAPQYSFAIPGPVSKPRAAASLQAPGRSSPAVTAHTNPHRIGAGLPPRVDPGDPKGM